MTVCVNGENKTCAKDPFYKAGFYWTVAAGDTEV